VFSSIAIKAWSVNVEMDGGGHSSFLEPDRERFYTETLSFLREGERRIDVCALAH